MPANPLERDREGCTESSMAERRWAANTAVCSGWDCGHRQDEHQVWKAQGRLRRERDQAGEPQHPDMCRGSVLLPTSAYFPSEKLNLFPGLQAWPLSSTDGFPIHYCRVCRNDCPQGQGQRQSSLPRCWCPGPPNPLPGVLCSGPVSHPSP